MELSKADIQAAMREFEKGWLADHPPTEPAEQEQKKAVLRKRQHAQFTLLFGAFVAGEYAIGDVVRFRLSSGTVGGRGEVLWSYGPGVTPVSHTPHALIYVVDAGRGAPVLVGSGEIVQGSE